jgi:hypothetical protein
MCCNEFQGPPLVYVLCFFNNLRPRRESADSDANSCFCKFIFVEICLFRRDFYA